MLKALSSMLNSMRESPWVRTGLLVVVIAFCGYGLYVEWPQAQVALARLHWYSVAGAALAAAAGAGCFMLAWRALLADLGAAGRRRPRAGRPAGPHKLACRSDEQTGSYLGPRRHGS